MNKKKRPIAVALFSGGLDSLLAARLMQEVGVDVRLLHFRNPFSAESGLARSAARQLAAPLEVIPLREDYLDVIRHPRHGYGKNMNPCIDCRIHMLKKAAAHMRRTGAGFLVTGEVVGERPMSQRRAAMLLIEKESGLAGLILRPLSAQLLEPTKPEQEGLVDRAQLLAIHGRSRKPQMALAERFGIAEYASPAGGCLLTDPLFAARLRDLMAHEPGFGLADVELLRYGRHFRLGPHVRIVVGRNEADNARILALAQEGDLVIEMADLPGPLTLARGDVADDLILLAGGVTARYTKARHLPHARISCRTAANGEAHFMTVVPLRDADLLKWRIGNAQDRV